MPEAELFLLFVRPLNMLGVCYMISGSVAAILYGEPRLTHDVDFVVFLRDNEIDLLVGAFPWPAFYVPPVKAIAAEVARPQRGHFNLVHTDTGFKADFYTAGREELHGWAFRNSRTFTYRGEPVVAAPPEYVIIRKLEYYREGRSEKHLRDVRSMLAVSGDQVDHAALEAWVQQRGVESEWRLVSQ